MKLVQIQTRPQSSLTSELNEFNSELGQMTNVSNDSLKIKWRTCSGRKASLPLNLGFCISSIACQNENSDLVLQIDWQAGTADPCALNGGDALQCFVNITNHL